MQRHRWSIVPVLGLFSSLLMLTACPAPKYPKCEKDAHCEEKGEVCVNGQCQECRDDNQCTAKYNDDAHVCMDGRCEMKAECQTNVDCVDKGDGLVCRAGQCVAECAANADCGSGKRCEAQKCVAECTGDVDCGPGRACMEGACQQMDARLRNVSATCRSTQSGQFITFETVYFDFDKYDLTPDARTTLNNNAECLKQAPALKVVLEGHCDDRGTQEYNLALGEKRANTVRSYLKNLGIPGARLVSRSKGENEPVCTEEDESCWSRNRRVQSIQSF